MTGQQRPVRVGIIGAGFVADLHSRVYRAIGRGAGEVVAVASRRRDAAAELARRFEIAEVLDEPAALLRRDDIDVVDLCVPNAHHESLAIAAAETGKHVICEKPLTGCFTSTLEDGSPRRRQDMFVQALESADRMVDACARNDVQLMYGENWLYMPTFCRVGDLLAESGGTILELRGEESHHGSHSVAARRWSGSGGGALMMLGVHPIGAILHLKRAEGMRRSGRPIRPRSVLAQVADLSQAEFFDEEHSLVAKCWEDVENWCTAIITFEDRTRGVISASYNCVGGMRDSLDIFASNTRFHCDLSGASTFRAFAPCPTTFGSTPLAEKLETNAGWSFPLVAEEFALGYEAELSDFLNAARTGSAPKSDSALAREVLAVVYGAYVSAEEGREVTLSALPGGA